MVIKNCIFYKLTEISIYDDEYYNKIPDALALPPSSDQCSNGDSNA